MARSMKILCFALCVHRLPFLVLLVIASITATPSQAFSPSIGNAVGTLLLRSSKAFSQALPETKIMQLARIAEKPGGTKVVGDELGRLNLPNDALEDKSGENPMSDPAQALKDQGWPETLQKFQVALNSYETNQSVLKQQVSIFEKELADRRKAIEAALPASEPVSTPTD